MQDLTARQLIGDELVIFNDLATAISSMVRVASKLGVERRPREVTPLSTYLNKGDGKSEDDIIEGEVIND